MTTVTNLYKFNLRLFFILFEKPSTYIRIWELTQRSERSCTEKLIVLCISSKTIPETCFRQDSLNRFKPLVAETCQHRYILYRSDSPLDSLITCPPNISFLFLISVVKCKSKYCVYSAFKYTFRKCWHYAIPFRKLTFNHKRFRCKNQGKADHESRLWNFYYIKIKTKNIPRRY